MRCGGLLALGFVAIPTLAHAEPTTQEAAAAEKLFQDALALMETGSYAKACPMLESSLRLDPGTGTRLNLALCYEGAGKTASAWASFNEVIGEAKRANPPRLDRVTTAEEHANALLPRLSYLTVRVDKDARVPGLTILVDGGPREEALWGTPLPVDPGVRVVAASASGKKPRTTEVQVGPSERQIITVAPLEDVPVVAPPRPPPPPVPVIVADGSSQRVLGYVVAGTGIAALGVGTIFGALALSSNADSKACGESPRCASDTAYRSADRDAWVANVALPVGVVALGVGIVLILTAHDERVARTLAGAW